MVQAGQAQLFETSRLRLRRLTMEDSEDVARLRSNPKIYYWRTPDSHDQAVHWLATRLESPQFLTCAIELLQKSEHQSPVIGLMGAHNLPEIGYVIDPAFWHQGYATEALQGWMKWYWDTYPDGHPSLLKPPDQHVLLAETGPEAAASRRVLQKCGFVFDGKRDDVEEGKPVRFDRWRYVRS